mmetsp:Transcript_2715/g.6750  ORF Transcript_2715/g.6750 Transcript_2715/m.6750 type:complete len:223 (+) Transcript_2715:254-922(+)
MPLLHRERPLVVLVVLLAATVSTASGTTARGTSAALATRQGQAQSLGQRPLRFIGQSPQQLRVHGHAEGDGQVGRDRLGSIVTSALGGGGGIGGDARHGHDEHRRGPNLAPNVPGAVRLAIVGVHACAEHPFSEVDDAFSEFLSAGHVHLQGPQTKIAVGREPKPKSGAEHVLQPGHQRQGVPESPLAIHLASAGASGQRPQPTHRGTVRRGTPAPHADGGG